MLTNDKTDEVKSELKRKIAIALAGTGNKVESSAKVLAPVRTGRLRDSITHIVDDYSVTIGTNVEYASYVELGTSEQGGHPYLRPAVENNIKWIRDFVEKTLKS